MSGLWPWLAPVLLVLLGSGAAVWWLRRRYDVVYVGGPSMEPTYPDGSRVVVRRATRAVRGDVVAFIPPFDEGVTPAKNGGNLWYLKRVAAGPGEVVPTQYLGYPGGVVTVPDGHYFLVGDNLMESADSRQEGPVDGRRLRGVVVREL